MPMPCTILRVGPFIQFIQRNSLVIVEQFDEGHLFLTMRTLERIVTEGNKDGITPFIEAHHVSVLLPGPETNQLGIEFAMSGI